MHSNEEAKKRDVEDVLRVGVSVKAAQGMKGQKRNAIS